LAIVVESVGVVGHWWLGVTNAMVKLSKQSCYKSWQKGGKNKEDAKGALWPVRWQKLWLG